MEAANAAGPAIMDEAATSTNPTLVPNKADTDTGIGWSTDAVEVIVNGTEELKLDAAAVTIPTNNLVATAGHIVAGATITTAGHPVMLNEVASATNPVFALADDYDTGIGAAAANKLALIAGATNAMSLEATVITPNVPIASGTLEITEVTGAQAINLVDLAMAGSESSISKAYSLAIKATPILTIQGINVSAALTEPEAVLGGFLRLKSSLTVTADIGSAQGGSPPVSALNVITTCTTAGDSVTMPVGTPGRVIRIVNLGAESADVFPASGADLGAGANTAVALAATADVCYVCIATNVWRDIT
jgi:hypothetical protein